MKLTIDGVTFMNPTHVRIDTDPSGETVGPWVIDCYGGKLNVAANGGASLTITCHGDARLVFGDATPSPIVVHGT